MAIEMPGGGRNLIAPSILSADFARLGDEVRDVLAAGADWIHFDVMDGRFVPNITIGPPVCAAVRKITDAPIDVHLMIVEPERYVQDFIDAGADVVTVHAEATTHLHRTVQQIQAAGARAGVTLNPGTHESVLDYVLDEVDLVLIMSVNPGFGGQSFIDSALRKAEAVREEAVRRGLTLDIEIDGGVKVTNIRQVADAGVNVFVAGSAIFRSENYKQTITSMREQLR